MPKNICKEFRYLFQLFLSSSYSTTGIVIVKANTNGLCNEGKTFYYVKRNNQKET